MSKIRELALEFRDPGFSSALVQTNRIKSKSLPCQPALPLNACSTISSNIRFREKCKFLPSIHLFLIPLLKGKYSEECGLVCLYFPHFLANVWSVVTAPIPPEKSVRRDELHQNPG